MATSLISINPATEIEIERFTVFDGNAVEQRLEGAVAAGRQLFDIGVERRASLLRQLGAGLRGAADSFASLITAEMGRPLAEARLELLKSAECCDYYADRAPALLADEPTPSDSPASRVSFVPLGPVMLIAPWNLPVWQVLRFAIPALAVGNPVLVKHAPSVTRCAIELERLILEAGFPPNSLTALLVEIPQAERIIADPRVKLVAITGSTATGARIAALAGASVKKCLLELGGSDAFIVLPDADIEAAAKMGVRSRFLNAGQTCLAAKRFLVAESVADAFEDAVTRIASALKIGDPTTAVDLGPLARADLRDKAERQIGSAIAEGARQIAGGDRPHARGYYVKPTVLADCHPEMTVFREETFGPILPIMRIRDAEHAIDVANRSQYGLSASVWTKDDALAEHVTARLETGAVFINGMTHSDPRLPFGGTKASGYGRDLGRFVINELTNIKTIWKPA